MSAHCPDSGAGMILDMSDTHTDQPQINGAAVAVDDTPQREQKHFSASEAAAECGVGRATIQRRLADGSFPNAFKNDVGWQIPLSDLLAQGFVPGRPAPAEEDTTPDREPDRSAEPVVPEHVQKVHELELQLAHAQAQAQIAQAVADERQRTIETQSRAMRMLEAAREDARTATEQAARAAAEAAIRDHEERARARAAEEAAAAEQSALEPALIPVAVEQPRVGWFKRNFGAQ